MGRRNVEVGFVVNPALLSAGAALAAIAVKFLGDSEEFVKDESGKRRPCGGCGGTGYVECFCTHWDFSAVAGEHQHTGCDKCRGSLRERCPRCNGSGGLRVKGLQPAVVPARVNNHMRINVAPFSVADKL